MFKSVILIALVGAVAADQHTVYKYKQNFSPIPSKAKPFIDLWAGVDADAGWETFYKGGVHAPIPFETYGIHLYAFGNANLNIELFNFWTYSFNVKGTLLDFTPFQAQFTWVEPQDDDDGLVIHMRAWRDLKLAEVKTTHSENAKVCGDSFVDTMRNKNNKLACKFVYNPDNAHYTDDDTLQYKIFKN